MSAVRKMDGRSPPPTPPGTAPALTGSAVAIAATGAASGGARVAAGGGALAVARPSDPGTGVASGMSKGASVGPPGVTAIVTVLSASAWVSRFVGYAVSRPDVVAERSAPSIRRDRDARALDHDLAPAEPVRVRGVRVRQVRAGRDRSRERHREAAHQAHRREPAHAGREGQARPRRGPMAWRFPSRASASDGASDIAGGHASRVRLVVGDLAVAVRIEVEACLERRDLRLVDDDVEQDALGLDPDPGVVVDREVAERMRGRDGGQQQHGQRGEGEGGASVGAIVERASSSWGVPGHAAYLHGCGADPPAVGGSCLPKGYAGRGVDG